MSKLRIYSDIHLDHYFAYGVPFDARTGEMKVWRPKELPNEKEQTLILAGDLWTGTRFIEFCGYSWITEMSGRFKNVIIVLGNHDYWPMNNALTIKTGADKARAMLADHGLYNVHILDMTVFDDGDILFVGATLWTDMDKGDPLAMHNMSMFMSYDGKIGYEHFKDGGFSRFTSEKWISTHIKHRDYIRLIAEQNRDRKIVVVTHHVPLLHLGDPCYAEMSSNAYYMSDLSDLILDNENLVLWAYGHTHYQMDRIFPDYAGSGGCRMYNNAVGYQGEHMEQQGLVKHEIVEV